jgi:hypothetical protein
MSRQRTSVNDKTKEDEGISWMALANRLML